MAATRTKSITIDVEAYRRLKGVQRENESFSQTIKRVVPRAVSTDALLSSSAARAGG